MRTKTQILNRVAATSNTINDRFPVWKQAGALRHPHSDDPPPDERDQLIGYEDATSSGGDHAPRPRRDSRRGALGRGSETGETRDLAEPGANLAVSGRGRLYLVDEAVEQEAGAEEGEGEEERDGDRLSAADRRHRRRGPTNQPNDRLPAPSRGPHRHQETVRTATPPTRYGRSRARG